MKLDFPSRFRRRAKVGKTAPAPRHSSTNVAPLPLPGELRPRLVALQDRHRRVVLLTSVAILLTALGLLLPAQALADRWFNLPWIVRAFFLLGDFAILGWLYLRHLQPGLRHRLTLSEAALRVEKKWPQVRHSLVTAVELAEGQGFATRGSDQLTASVLRTAADLTEGLDFKRTVPTTRLKYWARIAAATCGLALFLGALTWPTSLVLLERLFLATVPLPTRTVVIAITHDFAVPTGSEVELKAQAVGVIPREGRVTITYDGEAPVDFPLVASGGARDVFSLTIPNVQKKFQYTFHLNDGDGADFTVVAKLPPSVAAIECTEVFPDYTGLGTKQVPVSDLSLLAGSHLKIHATSTSPLGSATVVLQGVSQSVEMTLDAARTGLEADLPIPANDLTGLALHLVDQDGVASASDTIYPIQVVPDRPPVVKIISPEDDRETITLRAKPVISFEASDDYGLQQLQLCLQVVPPPVGAAEEGVPEEVRTIPIAVKQGNEGTLYRYTLNVAGQRPLWTEGCTVNYWVEATDNNTVTGPGVTKTAHKVFGILSPAEKMEEISERLKQAAQSIDALSQTQQQVGGQVGEAIPAK